MYILKEQWPSQTWSAPLSGRLLFHMLFMLIWPPTTWETTSVQIIEVRLQSSPDICLSAALPLCAAKPDGFNTDGPPVMSMPVFWSGTNKLNYADPKQLGVKHEKIQKFKAKSIMVDWTQQESEGRFYKYTFSGVSHVSRCLKCCVKEIKVIGFVPRSPRTVLPSQACFTCSSQNMEAFYVALYFALVFYPVAPESSTCLTGCSCTDDNLGRWVIAGSTDP